MTSPSSDGIAIDAVIRDAQRGDTHAFERLYREHADRVYAICLRMSADSDMATSLLQDVFVRVWRKLETFRGESAFSTWLHRLTVNEVLVQLRGDRRRRSREILETDSTGFDHASSRSATPGLRIDLEHAISQLPDSARMVFVLHDIEGLRHHEIAEQLDIAVGTSKAHLHRARRRLREVLGDESR